jgi:hypothetical protein
VTRYALAGVAVAVCFPTAAAADSVETTTTFTVRPGPLALYGVPAERSFTPLIRCTAAGLSAVLPSIRVVDATGSGRGWQLAVSVVGGGEAWVRTAVSDYNGPPRMWPHSAGDVRLTEWPRTVAFALRDQGMGTTVLRGMSLHAHPGVRVRFVLEPGP